MGPPTVEGTGAEAAVTSILSTTSAQATLEGGFDRVCAALLTLRNMLQILRLQTKFQFNSQWD